MRKQWRFGLSALLVPALIVVLLVPHWRSALWDYLRGGRPEQVYAEKPTSHWVKEMKDLSLEAFSNLGGAQAEALPVLLEALKENDVTVRSMSRSFLFSIVRRDRNALPYLIDALKDEDRTVRLTAVRAILEMINIAFGRKFYRASASISEEGTVLLANQRRANQRATANVKPTWRPDLIALPALIETLSDEDAVVRARVVSLLASIGPEAQDAVPGLIERLKDPDEDVRSQAIAALGRVGPESTPAAAALLDVLKDGPLAAREKAAFALADSTLETRRAAVPLLLDLLKAQMENGEPLTGADTLKRLGSDAEQAVPGLIELVHVGDPRDPGRQTVLIELLGAIGPSAKGAVPLLLDSVNGGDNLLRVASAVALHHIDPESAKSAVPVLAQMLQDKTAAIHPVEYAKALALIDPERSKALVPNYIEGLTATDPSDRLWSAGILAGFGPQAKAAVPVLKKLLHDKDTKVRGAVSAALAVIDHPTD